MGGNFYKFWSSSLLNNSHLSLVTGMKVSVHILYLSTSKPSTKNPDLGDQQLQ